MKNLVLILIYLFVAQTGFGQETNKLLIDDYQEYVDSLVKTNQLKERIFPDMSDCGGYLRGFYLDSTLIYICSYNSAEAGGSGQDAYIKNTSVIKIIYHQHFAEWDKHSKNYPKESQIGNYDNMTYTDTTYYLYITEKPLMFKYSKTDFINDKLDLDLFNWLLANYQCMVSELKGDEEGASKWNQKAGSYANPTEIIKIIED